MGREIKRSFYIPKFGATVSIIAEEDGSSIKAIVNHETFEEPPQIEYFPKNTAAWYEVHERVSNFVKEVCKNQLYGRKDEKSLSRTGI